METVKKFNSSSFGDFLRTKRLEKTYSQDKMAILLGLSQNAYCLIENGRTQITIERIKDLAIALDMKPWELLEEYREYLINKS